MMSPRVQDFAHYVGILLAAFLVVGAAGYLAAYSWHAGDGAAAALASAIQPLLIVVFVSLVALLGVNVGANALVAIKTAQASANTGMPNVAQILAAIAADVAPGAGVPSPLPPLPAAPPPLSAPSAQNGAAAGGPGTSSSGTGTAQSAASPI